MNSGNFQKKIYDNWQGYTSDPNISIVNLRYRKIREYIKEQGKGKKILDVGCADGLLLEPLIPAFDVYGIEIAEHLCNTAREKGLNVLLADLEQGIPFESETFDIVVAAEIIEHIADTDFFLSECNRVLKKNGKLILSVPNINNIFSPFFMLFFDYPPTSSSRYRSTHVRDFTLSTLKVALQNNSFMIEKTRGVVFYAPFIKGMLVLRGFLADLMPRFADEYVLIAKKEKECFYNIEKTIKESNSKFLLKKMPFWKMFFRNK